MKHVATISRYGRPRFYWTTFLLAGVLCAVPFTVAQDSHQQHLAPVDSLCFRVDWWYDIGAAPVPTLTEFNADVTGQLVRMAESLGVTPHVFDGRESCPFEGGLIVSLWSDGFVDAGSLIAVTSIEVSVESFAGLRNAIIWDARFFVSASAPNWPEPIAGDIERTIRRFEEDWRAAHPGGE